MPDDNDDLYFDGYVFPAPLLPQVRQALAQWPGLPSGPVPDNLPAWWMWDDRGGLICLTLAGSTREAVIAMRDIMEDMTARWATEDAQGNFPRVAGHRYIHTAASDEECWGRLFAVLHERLGEDPERRRLLLRFGRMMVAYREYPFGGVAAAGSPDFQPMAACHLLAPHNAKTDYLKMVALLQEDANYMQETAPEPPRDGRRRKAVVADVRLMPHEPKTRKH